MTSSLASGPYSAEAANALVRAVEAIQPATIEQIREALGEPWRRRGTVRNRVYEAEEMGLLICDEGRPMRFAINEDTR